MDILDKRFFYLLFQGEQLSNLFFQLYVAGFL